MARRSLVSSQLFFLHELELEVCRIAGILHDRRLLGGTRPGTGTTASSEDVHPDHQPDVQSRPVGPLQVLQFFFFFFINNNREVCVGRFLAMTCTLIYD